MGKLSGELNALVEKERQASYEKGFQDAAMTIFDLLNLDQDTRDKTLKQIMDRNSGENFSESGCPDETYEKKGVRTDDLEIDLNALVGRVRKL